MCRCCQISRACQVQSASVAAQPKAPGRAATVPSSERCTCNVQEVQIMQTLSDIPEVVRCFAYHPQPKALGRSALKVCQLVMELMEVQDPEHTPPSAEDKLKLLKGGVCRH